MLFCDSQKKIMSAPPEDYSDRVTLENICGPRVKFYKAHDNNRVEYLVKQVQTGVETQWLVKSCTSVSTGLYNIHMRIYHSHILHDYWTDVILLCELGPPMRCQVTLVKSNNYGCAESEKYKSVELAECALQPGSVCLPNQVASDTKTLHRFPIDDGALNNHNATFKTVCMKCARAAIEDDDGSRSTLDLTNHTSVSLDDKGTYIHVLIHESDAHPYSFLDFGVNVSKLSPEALKRKRITEVDVEYHRPRSTSTARAAKHISPLQEAFDKQDAEEKFRDNWHIKPSLEDIHRHKNPPPVAVRMPQQLPDIQREFEDQSPETRHRDNWYIRSEEDDLELFGRRKYANKYADSWYIRPPANMRCKRPGDLIPLNDVLLD